MPDLKYNVIILVKMRTNKQIQIGTHYSNNKNIKEKKKI